MGLTVLASTVEPIEVRRVRSETTPISINLDPGLSVYLTEEQATKLCFDLLAMVPPVEIVQKIESMDLDHRISQ